MRTVHRFGYAFAPPEDEEAAAQPSRHVLTWASREFPLLPGENVVGRDPGAAVPIEVIPDELVAAVPPLREAGRSLSASAVARVARRSCRASGPAVPNSTMPGAASKRSGQALT